MNADPVYLLSSDAQLRALVGAIASGDEATFNSLLTPELARARFAEGASRQNPSDHFLEAIAVYIYAGDTALHVAAAADRPDMVDSLLAAGADVRARNRRRSEPLHAAVSASPQLIERLVAAGADPNTQNMDGATPLHRAVRNRCAEAVRTLLRLGANPGILNKRGSSAADLAVHSTGRSGSGTAAAKEQQRQILEIFRSSSHSFEG